MAAADPAVCTAGFGATRLLPRSPRDGLLMGWAYLPALNAGHRPRDLSRRGPGGRTAWRLVPKSSPMRRPEWPAARCRSRSATTISSEASGSPRSRADSPSTALRRPGSPFTEVPQSTPEDVELALDAAHAAKGAWGETSITERARPERDRRCDRRQQGDARGRRELGQRQARPGDAGRRHPAGRGPLPLLRRRHPRRRGLDHRARQGHRSPTTSGSRSAWSARSFRSTSRS